MDANASTPLRGVPIPPLPPSEVGWYLGCRVDSGSRCYGDLRHYWWSGANWWIEEHGYWIGTKPDRLWIHWSGPVEHPRGESYRPPCPESELVPEPANPEERPMNNPRPDDAAIAQLLRAAASDLQGRPRPPLEEGMAHLGLAKRLELTADALSPRPEPEPEPLLPDSMEELLAHMRPLVTALLEVAPVSEKDSAHNQAVRRLELLLKAVPHDDDVAVDRFAAAMKAKLRRKRAEGCDGWKRASIDYLFCCLKDHVMKGDPVDVGNFAMMIFSKRGIV